MIYHCTGALALIYHEWIRSFFEHKSQNSSESYASVSKKNHFSKNPTQKHPRPRDEYCIKSKMKPTQSKTVSNAKHKKSSHYQNP